MPRARMRSAFTRSLKYGNGRHEALGGWGVLLGREPVDQPSVAGRALALERILLGARERNDRAGVCAMPPISTGKPAPADAVDQTDAVRSRGLVRAVRPLCVEPPFLDVGDDLADDQPIDPEAYRPAPRGIAPAGGGPLDEHHD